MSKISTSTRPSIAAVCIEGREILVNSKLSLSIADVCRALEKKYAIKFKTLVNYFSENREVASFDLKEDSRMLLSYGQELALASFLLRQSSRGHHEYVAALPGLVRSFSDESVSPEWCHKFLKRRAGWLQTTANLISEKARIASAIVLGTESFNEEYDLLLTTTNVKNRPHALFTLDESLLQMTNKSVEITRIKGRDSRGEPSDVRGELYGSMLNIISATGRHWMTVINVKSSDGSDGKADNFLYLPVQGRNSVSNNSAYKVILCRSESGLFGTKQFEDVMCEFMALCETHGLGDSMKIVLSDNLGIHRNPSLTSFCLKKYLYQVAYTPNASSFMAPLDDLVYATFKQVFSKLYREKIHNSNLSDDINLQQRMIIPSILTECLNASFTQAIIVKSFKNTGMYPHNPSLLMQRAREQVSQNTSVFMTDMESAIVSATTNMVEKTMEESIKTQKAVQKTRSSKMTPIRSTKRQPGNSIANQYNLHKLANPVNFLLLSGKKAAVIKKAVKKKRKKSLALKGRVSQRLRDRRSNK